MAGRVAMSGMGGSRGGRIEGSGKRGGSMTPPMGAGPPYPYGLGCRGYG